MENAERLDQDEQLIQRSRQGDHGALAALISKYRPMVCAKAAFYHAHGLAESDDLIQEGLLALFQAIRRYEKSRGASFKTFAQVCITSKLRSALATAGRKKHTLLDAAVPLTEAVLTPDDEFQIRAADPQDVFAAQEKLAQLESQIQQTLSEYERQVLDLYLMGNSYEQMAARLGSSEKSIDNALQRIRRKLKCVVYEDTASI